MPVDYNHLPEFFLEKNGKIAPDFIFFLKELVYLSHDYDETDTEDPSGEYEDFYLEHRILEFQYQGNKLWITQTTNPFYSDVPKEYKVDYNQKILSLEKFILNFVYREEVDDIMDVFHDLFEHI